MSVNGNGVKQVVIELLVLTESQLLCLRRASAIAMGACATWAPTATTGLPRPMVQTVPGTSALIQATSLCMATSVATVFPFVWSDRRVNMSRPERQVNMLTLGCRAGQNGVMLMKMAFTLMMRLYVVLAINCQVRNSGMSFFMNVNMGLLMDFY